MNSPHVVTQRAQVEEFQRKHRIGLLALVFTDIVDSTLLKQQHGDAQAVMLIHRHNELVRETLAQFTPAEEIETAGDSFLLVLAKPSDAVKFALVLQSRLRALAAETRVGVFDRIGIHVGEVFIEEQKDSPKLWHAGGHLRPGDIPGPGQPDPHDAVCVRQRTPGAQGPGA